MLPPFPLDSDGALLAYAELLERNTDNHVAVDRIRWWATVRESLTRDLDAERDRSWSPDVEPLIRRLPAWIAGLGSYEFNRRIFDRHPIDYSKIWNRGGGWAGAGYQQVVESAWSAKLLWFFKVTGPPNLREADRAAWAASWHSKVSWAIKSAGAVQAVQAVWAARAAFEWPVGRSAAWGARTPFEWPAGRSAAWAFGLFTRLNRESRKPGRPRRSRHATAIPA